MTAKHWLAVSLAWVTLAGCGAAAPSRVAPTPGPTEPSVAELELAQQEQVARFDSATAGDDACERLCHHLEQICVLSERICDLVDRLPAPEPEPEPEPNACHRATDRCKETGERLPSSCVCELPAD